MRIAIGALVALVIGSVVLAGCGGASSAAPSAAAPSVDGASAAPSVDGASAAPSIEAPSAAPSTGGGAAGGVCDLVTSDELAGILGSPVTTSVLAGPPDTCDIQSTDGAPLAAMVWMQQGGGAAFDAWASSSGVVEIPGIGDRAIFEPSSQLVLVKKGDQSVSIAVFDDGSEPEARLELQKKIAQIAAGRF